MCEDLAEQGTVYDIQFHFDKALTFNTLSAHCLLHWAKTQNKANELKGALMHAYFTSGADLAKKQNLVAIAEKTGLDKDKAIEILESDAYLNDVYADISRAQKLGVRGVPYFLINEKETISGAQSDSVFERSLEAALSNMKTEEDATSGGFCLPNGECK